MMTTTTRHTAAAFALLLLISTTSSVTASNPFNYTPSISLLDGSGEVNENGFCLRLISNHPLKEATKTIDCSTNMDDSVTIMGSSCLPSSGEGTHFGYNEDDQTIYAVNVVCDDDEDEVENIDAETAEDSDASDLNDLTIAVTSKSGGVSHTGRRTCLTVEKPISEGSGLILTECYNNHNNSTSAAGADLMQQQTFTYTSSGKFRIDIPGNNNSTAFLCLGMDDFIWQQGAPSPYVDPTFWRELTLMACDINEDDQTTNNSTHHALITWLVNPTPTLNVVEDGPFPITSTSSDSLEDDEIFEDEEIDADMEDDDELSMLVGHHNNITTAATKPENGTDTAPVTSVAKKSGSNLRRIL